MDGINEYESIHVLPTGFSNIYRRNAPAAA
jgi:hypothetical protein